MQNRNLYGIAQVIGLVMIGLLRRGGSGSAVTVLLHWPVTKHSIVSDFLRMRSIRPSEAGRPATSFRVKLGLPVAGKSGIVP